MLLVRAVKTLRGLENSGREVVAALMPGARASTRMSRGGIQRVLHGLGEEEKMAIYRITVRVWVSVRLKIR